MRETNLYTQVELVQKILRTHMQVRQVENSRRRRLRHAIYRATPVTVIALCSPNCISLAVSVCHSLCFSLQVHCCESMFVSHYLSHFFILQLLWKGGTRACELEVSWSILLFPSSTNPFVHATIRSFWSPLTIILQRGYGERIPRSKHGLIEAEFRIGLGRGGNNN